MKNIKNLITKSYNAKFKIEDQRELVIEKTDLNQNSYQYKRPFLPSLLSLIVSFTFVVIGSTMIFVAYNKGNETYVPSDNPAIEYLRTNSVSYIDSPIIQESMSDDDYGSLGFEIYYGAAKEYLNNEFLIIIQFNNIGNFNMLAITDIYENLLLGINLQGNDFIILNTNTLSLDFKLSYTSEDNSADHISITLNYDIYDFID